jgi:hypothetical protein
MTGYVKAYRVFNENGIIILDCDREIGRTIPGKLEICYTQVGSKFYRFIHSPQAQSWVYIADVETKILYGGTIVDFRKGDDNNPTIYLVCLSDLALLKFNYGSSKRYWWIVHEGRFVKKVPTEWLLYYNLIPGVEEYEETAPPQTPENIKTILQGLVNLTEEPLIK